jgi:hypothetical protein
MQQLVWETEPSHSLSAQMLMIYSFVLPKLSAHAIKLVMGLMHYDELRRMASTRRALAGAPGPIKLVPPMKVLSAQTHSAGHKLTATRSQRVLVVEVDGIQVTIPANTAILVDRNRSCRPHKVIAQMKVNATQPVHSGAAGEGSQSFFSGSEELTYVSPELLTPTPRRRLSPFLEGSTSRRGAEMRTWKHQSSRCLCMCRDPSLCVPF